MIDIRRWRGISNYRAITNFSLDRHQDISVSDSSSGQFGLMMASQDTLVRCKVHPEVGNMFGMMGKQLVEQRSTGGINPFLGLGNLRGMPFPVLAPKDHQRIGDLVQETVEKAQAAEREAANLLEDAKQRVEELIERNAAA